MRTAWKPNARTLADRDDELNNFGVETCTTTYLQWNFSEKYYTVLKEYIKSLNMSEWMNIERRPKKAAPGTTEAFENED